jgi:hypothetical protein
MALYERILLRRGGAYRIDDVRKASRPLLLIHYECLPWNPLCRSTRRTASFPRSSPIEYSKFEAQRHGRRPVLHSIRGPRQTYAQG